MSSITADSLGRARWRGQPGRTEVWYATCTDAASGTGLWVHHETVAPHDGTAPYAHGWTVLFEPGRAPVTERFGPGPVTTPPEGAWHVADGCQLGPGHINGSAGTLGWNLAYEGGGPPLFTFPKAVWERELLPGAQVVPVPAGAFTGAVVSAGRTIPLSGHGALARIYGHGSAERWGWLHADLDGEGVLEIVTASARRRALRRIPPLALVQLRRAGHPDWPARPLLAAPRFRTTLGPSGFQVRGRTGGCRLQVDVRLPEGASVALRYVDPDGATATCTNSERATATVTVEDGAGTKQWQLDGVAHAEVGHRP